MFSESWKRIRKHFKLYFSHFQRIPYMGLFRTWDAVSMKQPCLTWQGGGQNTRHSVRINHDWHGGGAHGETYYVTWPWLTLEWGEARDLFSDIAIMIDMGGGGKARYIIPWHDHNWYGGGGGIARDIISDITMTNMGWGKTKDIFSDTTMIDMGGGGRARDILCDMTMIDIGMWGRARDIFSNITTMIVIGGGGSRDIFSDITMIGMRGGGGARGIISDMNLIDMWGEHETYSLT